MTRKQFVEQCELRGVCSEYTARVYADRFPKKYVFTEDDFVLAYRAEDIVPMEEDEKYLVSRGFIPEREPYDDYS